MITLLSLSLMLLYGCQQIKGLYLLKMHVPEVADYRDTVKLSCQYDMENTKLNSVKWYKDNKEFYRFSPMTELSIMSFPVDGVSLNSKSVCNKESCTIYLQHLTNYTAGAYRCEISGDAPEFKLVHETSNMTVAALPKIEPFVSGVASRYKMGDYVIANCTTDTSFPPATITWYINDEPALPEFQKAQQETVVENDRFTLLSRTKEIQFRIDKARFGNSKGILKLKCLATIDKILSATKETTIMADITTNDDLMDTQKYLKWNGSSSANGLSTNNRKLLTTLLLVLLTIFATHR